MSLQRGIETLKMHLIVIKPHLHVAKIFAECSRTQREVSIMFVALLAAAEARTPHFAVIEQEWKIFCCMTVSIMNELHCDLIAEERYFWNSS